MNDIEVELRQVSASTSEASLRSHHVLIDRPQEKGGADQGPMGGELFLAAIGGCFMSNLLAAITARKADICGVWMRVTGTLAEAPPRFAAVEVLVSAHGPADQLERLLEVADKGCIMMNTLRGTLEVRIRITNTLIASSR
jgi:putative redox protein